jgi:hypothetical protein
LTVTPANGLSCAEVVVMALIVMTSIANVATIKSFFNITYFSKKIQEYGVKRRNPIDWLFGELSSLRATPLSLPQPIA